MLFFFLSLAWASDPLPELSPGVVVADSPSGRLSSRVGWGDGADLVLLYGGEQLGRVGPCGCEDQPVGGLPRVSGYREALVEANPGVPVLLLNPGVFYAAQLGETVELSSATKVANHWMKQGLEAASWDALNVSCRDMPGAMAGGFPEGALSTNLRVDGLPNHRVIEAGPLTVAVLGVGRSCLDYLQPEGLVVSDPHEAVASLVPTLEADLVVLLVTGLGGSVQSLAEIPGVDVVLEAGGFFGRYDPFEVSGTIWTRSFKETRRLKELRLLIDEGRVSGARDRTITLDARIPSDRGLRKLLAEPLDVEAQGL